MQFEEVLERIYVGEINETTNNHIYIHLSKDQLKIIREVLAQNPIFEPTNPNRYSMFFKNAEYGKMCNIEVDFNRITITDLLNYILFRLGIKYRIDFHSYKDLLLFIEVLKSTSKNINLHFFNTNLLNNKETELLNDLIIMNLTMIGMQIYLLDGKVLNSEVDERGNEVEAGVHYEEVPVEKQKFSVNTLEYKAS